MANANGPQLAQGIQEKIKELKAICAGIDEKTASRAPAGRWSPKEILSHLCGAEDARPLTVLQLFLDKEMPTIDIRADDPFFTDTRARMTFAQLVATYEKEYDAIAQFASDLSEEQLARKAHIPKFKESPLGEYPTLGQLINGFGEYHVQFHIDHLRSVLQELSKQ
jgi:hypothetical protein